MCRNRERTIGWADQTWVSCACIGLACVLAWSGPLALGGDLLFRRHVLSDQTDYSAAGLIDVNRDGRVDIVCGGDWYEAPHWEKHFVADIPRIGGRPDGFSHQEFDVNRDGWTDIITVNWRSQSIKWMQHPGPSLGPWTIHTVVEPGPMESGRLVDIDGDGQLDLLPNGGNFAAWWEFRWNSDGPGDPAWIRNDLPDAARGHGMGFGDIDGDGRGDIVGQNGWLQAPADRRHGRWLWHDDYRLERASIPMIVTDVDDDGDSDIVWCSAHGFGVYWLEQTRLDDQRQWIRHAIDTSWSQGHSPLWVDLDADGRNELVIGKRYMAHGGADPGEYDPIAVYRYQFDPARRTWNRWLVSPHWQRVGVGLDPKAGDLDSDGDIDLVMSGRSGLYWLENVGPGDSGQASTPSAEYADHEALLVVRDHAGQLHEVRDAEQWGLRRSHIVEAIERSHGQLPECHQRVPLDVRIEDRSDQSTFIQEQLHYQIDSEHRTAATLFSPREAELGETPGVLCMFRDPRSVQSQQFAQELARRGVVCLLPELVATPSASKDGIRNALWQSMRGLDLLQAHALVHGERLGYIGDALDGELGLYVAAVEQRVLASWTDAGELPEATAGSADRYSLSELLACAAPRAVHVVVSEGTATDFEQAVQSAQAVFELRRAAERLSFSHPVPEDEAVASAVAWLEDNLFPRRRPPQSR